MNERLKASLKKIQPLNAAWSFLRTAKCNYYLSRWEKNKPDNRHISVAFLAQLPEIWDKQDTVFEKMLADSRFDPFLVAVPSYDIVKGEIGAYGYELEYFEKKYPAERVLKAKQEDGSWLDLKACGFDYVFYQRPYESYLPRQYDTAHVIQYSRTAYIPYYYQYLNFPLYEATGFFNNLYLFFASSEADKRQSRIMTKRHVVSVGYPVLERVKPAETAQKKFTFLWTPRWIDDEQTGGSNFMKYKDLIVKWKAERDDIRLIIRPHPMTFANAIKEGKMSPSEVRDYKNSLIERHITLDSNIFAEDTFAEMDALITDTSSIIISAFVTGKPIIYCSNPQLDFTEDYQKIIGASYQVSDWENLLRTAEMLAHGDDPMKERRLDVISCLNVPENSVDSILETLARGGCAD